MKEDEAKLASIAKWMQELEHASGDANTELRRVAEVAAIGAVAGCYGRGHDAVVPGKEVDQSEALVILQSCFADDVQSEFRYFGNPVQAADRLDGLPALVEYFGSVAPRLTFASSGRAGPARHPDQ